MSEKIYKITLADGTIIDNLRLNGNNYISEEAITQEMFEDNLSHVVISDGENEEEYDNMRLVQLANYDEKYWFILRQLTEAEIEREQGRRDIADLKSKIASIEASVAAL